MKKNYCNELKKIMVN